MFGSAHHPQPHHPPHPPYHPPQPHHHHPSHPADNACAQNTWRPPLPTERDRSLLTELLGSEQEAQALLQTIQSSSPDIAAIGYLMLRVLEQARSN
jgi:hypothetical protein